MTFLPRTCHVSPEKSSVGHSITWALEADKMKGLKLVFKQTHGIPQCVDAINCKHNPLGLPAHARCIDWHVTRPRPLNELQPVIDWNMIIDAFAAILVSLVQSAHKARFFSGLKCWACQDRDHLINPLKLIYGTLSEIHRWECWIHAASLTHAHESKSLTQQ